MFQCNLLIRQVWVLPVKYNWRRNTSAQTCTLKTTLDQNNHTLVVILI